MTGPGRPGSGDTGRDAVDTTIGYGDAVAELEQILNELERNDVDIDILGPKVQRAAALIRLCRDRIASARVDVEQIVSDLDATTGNRTDGADDTGP